MVKKFKCNKLGLGSLSLFLCIFSFIFSFIRIDGISLIGDNFLSFLGLSISPVFISLILFLISTFLGYRYKNDLLAKTGMKASVILCIYSIFILILSVPYLNNIKIVVL